MNHERAPTVLYIFGAGHSGSTLLDVLLSQHNSVIGLGEAHRLTLEPDVRQCGCGEPLAKCPFWMPIIMRYLEYTSVPARLQAEWFLHAPVSLQRVDAGPLFRKGLALDALAILGSKRLVRWLSRVDRWTHSYSEIIRNSLLLYRVAAECNGASVVVDSTKNPLRGKMMYMSSARPQQVRCLHLVRDGRAVSASMMRREKVEMTIAGKAWKATNRKVELALASVPYKDRCRIRYEDLYAEPLAELTKIFRWLGLDVPDERSVVKAPKGTQHQIPGNPMLFFGVDTISLDERWRRELDENEMSAFTSVAGAWNRRYGYEDDVT